MNKLIPIFILLFSVTFSFAQAGRDEALANSYFQEGEYEKAVELYQSLWEKNDNAPKFYSPLFKCYVNLKQYEALEKVVRKQQKKFLTNAQYAVDLGYALNLSGQAAKGKEQFDKLIKSLPQNEVFIKELGAAFETYKEFDFAIQVYEKGGKLFNNSVPFGFLLANAYAMKGDYDNAAKEYINFYELQPAQSQNVKNQLMRSTSEKLLGAVEVQLYAKLQRNSGDEYLSDLLIWIYIQNKDFDGAMQQTKAIDRRKSENGFRVLNLARMASAEDMFDVAINGYEYVVAKGKESPLYLMARTELLNCRKEKIASKVNYAREDLIALKGDYESFINEIGRGNQTAQSMKELAELNGFYLQDIPAAISICEEILKMNGISRELKNQTKLSLGDFLLIDGDVWESSLLYGQVDKEEKDSPLGEEARFRNAKLSYFKGDVEWAKTQLEVLKSSTSELISNDAIDLSVFIIDNSGMDSDVTPLQMFARAELQMYQNLDIGAVSLLDSIKLLFPGHDLYDDILYTQAKIYTKKRLFDKAVPLLDEVIKNYKTDLKGDDATFLLAEINEQHLGNKEKAKELYQSIITDFDSSLLVIEALKRFRILRGDKVSE